MMLSFLTQIEFWGFERVEYILGLEDTSLITPLLAWSQRPHGMEQLSLALHGPSFLLGVCCGCHRIATKAKWKNDQATIHFKL